MSDPHRSLYIAFTDHMVAFKTIEAYCLRSEVECLFQGEDVSTGIWLAAINPRLVDVSYCYMSIVFLTKYISNAMTKYI